MADMPAQVRKPKQKAAIEGAVGKAMTVISPLRNEIFTTVSELKVAIREKLEIYNAKPFQKREGSRRFIFTETEQEKLHPLPSIPYDIAEWFTEEPLNSIAILPFKKITTRIPTSM
ncbi:hypothetical protein G7058_03660 [Jeotgalibaca porci]|uniref:Uncharacterized protein n=1 Tax=Jeotgalibaca porci TaxID=1868793 RepID=A0A6G7WG71_9LACT|nr:hypothetical protein [Jeotgalibaca porci]QIK51231.1 hypothetical protein G7058_03660 [Jeotgalibaca porci]